MLYSNKPDRSSPTSHSKDVAAAVRRPARAEVPVAAGAGQAAIPYPDHSVSFFDARVLDRLRSPLTRYRD